MRATPLCVGIPDPDPPYILDPVTAFSRPDSLDLKTTDEVFPLVYEELKKLADRHLAGEQDARTLQPTALVHEAYLRLVGNSAAWESRAHFFGAAARAIRRILIDRARARGRLRHGGGDRPLPLDSASIAGAGEPSYDLLALDEALERLAAIDAQQAQVVELRFFGGLPLEETAVALGVSPSTVARAWRLARIWLFRELAPDGAP
jgi:RNA polymerase sigma factor (TIGR02999 family)